MTSSIQLKDGIANTVANDQSQGMIIKIVGAVAVAHLLNDLIQAVLPAIYPMLKANFSLSFAEVGLISFVYQITGSLLQPWIGLYTDKHQNRIFSYSEWSSHSAALSCWHFHQVLLCCYVHLH